MTQRTEQTHLVLDPEVLQELLDLGGEDDPELAVDLLRTYLEDSPPRLAALLDGIRKRDGDAVERCAHALKSSSAQVGALTFARCCGELEERARSSRLDGADRLGRRIAAEFEHVVAALHEKLPGLARP